MGEHPLRRMSLRSRLMVIGTAGLILGLGLGSALFYGVLTFALNRTLDNEALASARQVAAMVDEGRLPQPIPVSGVRVIQVIDSAGRVRAASIGADRLTPLLRPDERTPGRRTVPGERTGVDEPLRVVSVAAGGTDDPQLVLVALPIGEVDRSTRLLGSTLLVACPLLILVLALLAWRVIGWTLRPVEVLRSDADRISGTGRTDRLAVPEAADELRALAVTLNGMLDRLASSRERQRAFVADAAHELRSPLASMRIQLEVAQRLSENIEPAELLPDVDRLTRLVEDLLLLARADADVAPPAAVTRFAMRALLEAVARAYAEPAVALTVMGEEDTLAWAAPEEIRRALYNLVDNALRHARTSVELACASQGEYVLVTVTDDGPGIPHEDLDRVFDRFVRLDEARDRDAGGSGLGLSIVQELVHRSGGDVRLTDAAPGLRVEIRLPIR